MPASVQSVLDKKDDWVIVNDDCLKVMRDIPPNSVDLIFADPPFNIGYEYDVHDDSMSSEEYVNWAWRWLSKAVTRLKPTGSIFLAIGDEFAAEYKKMLDDCGLHMRNWIIWHYTFGPHQEKKFGRDHVHILYFVRDPKGFVFNADSVRVPSKRQETGDKRAHPAGRVPGDVWEFPRVTGNSHEREDHPCQMPEAILERIIRVATTRSDLVFDPFSGSGTTASVCRRLGRRFIGTEISAKYHSQSLERLKDTTTELF